MEEESTSLILLDTSSPITLELLLLRDCTPIMSNRFFYDLKEQQRKQEKRETASCDQIPGKPNSDAIPSLDSTVLSSNSSTEVPSQLQQISPCRYELILAKSLPSNVNLIGVYGISVDQQGHVWFGTNHLGIIHRLTKEFEVILQYIPLDEEKYRIVNNFREIKFKDDKAYVLDAGSVADPPQIHIFQMPDFAYERTIDIPYTADELFSWYSRNIMFYKGNILVYHGALTDNSGEHLPSARLQIVYPSDGKQRFIMADGMEEVFVYRDELYGISAGRDFDDESKPGAGPLHIVKLNDDFSAGERITSEKLQRFLEITGPIYVDRNGLLFKAGNLYDPVRDKWDSWISAATLDGRVLGMQRLPHGISPICFDNENNLIGIVHYKSRSDDAWHLLLGKWRINYRELLRD